MCENCLICPMCQAVKEHAMNTTCDACHAEALSKIMTGVKLAIADMAEDKEN